MTQWIMDAVHLPFTCAICGIEGSWFVWRKLRVFRLDKKVWTREAAPVHPDCYAKQQL